ncbi:CvpA family protein [Porphyromonas pogonae]|uniref:CvpA family protein n=1 Tax=Porphyromonas pogonae TaxID=867595 RepID=UPI002E79BE87|nr:CvpA family protein [Porphyromonas pogonae]
MNWLDLVLIIIIGWFTVKGFLKGAVKQILGIAIFIIALRESWRLQPWVETNILPVFNVTGSMVKPFSILLSFVFFVIIGTIIGYFLIQIPKLGFLGFINHLVGGLCGFIITVLVIGYISLGFDKIVPARSSAYDAQPAKTDSRVESKFYYKIQHLVKDIERVAGKKDHQENGTGAFAPSTRDEL